MTSIRKLIVLACSIALGQEGPPLAVDSQIYALAARFTMRLCESPPRNRRRLAPVEFCGRSKALARTQYLCGAVRSKIYRSKIDSPRKTGHRRKTPAHRKAGSVTGSYQRNRIRAADKAPACQRGAPK